MLFKLGKFFLVKFGYFIRHFIPLGSGIVMPQHRRRAHRLFLKPQRRVSLEGQIIASKSGHRLNNLLLKELFKNKANYEIVNSTLEDSFAPAKEWTESVAVGS